MAKFIKVRVGSNTTAKEAYLNADQIHHFQESENGTIISASGFGGTPLTYFYSDQPPIELLNFIEAKN